MTKDQFDKEVQAHISRFIRDADEKESASIAQKKLLKHRAKAAKTNSLNRSSMSTLLSPKDAGTKIAEGILSSIEAKYSTIFEGEPKLEEPAFAPAGTGRACGDANDCHLEKGHKGKHVSRNTDKDGKYRTWWASGTQPEDKDLTGY